MKEILLNYWKRRHKWLLAHLSKSEVLRKTGKCPQGRVGGTVFHECVTRHSLFLESIFTIKIYSQADTDIGIYVRKWRRSCSSAAILETHVSVAACLSFVRMKQLRAPWLLFGFLVTVVETRPCEPKVVAELSAHVLRKMCSPASSLAMM